MRFCGPLLLALASILATIATAQETHGISAGYLDTTCAPCQDFYAYANGGWINRTSLPDKGAARGALDELNARRATTLSQSRPPPTERSRD
jgi:predicted metalloendopeptidase